MAGTVRPPSFILRAIGRLAVAGATLLVLVPLAGWGIESARFGQNEADARARVADRVTRAVRDLESRLSGVVAATPVEASDLVLAAQHDGAAERRLFDQLERGRPAPGGPAVAATLYGPTGVPVAWMGRAADVLDARLQGGPSTFLMPATQGLLVVRVQPVTEPGPPGRRVGALVVQALLAPATPGGADEGVYLLPTGILTVPVRPQAEPGVAASPDALTIRSVNGEVLGAFEVPAAALAQARGALRQRLRAGMLAIVAVLLLLLAGPLLDWRRVTRSLPAAALATVGVAVLLLGAWSLLQRALDLATRPGALPLAPSPQADWATPAVFFASAPHFLLASLLVAGLTALAASTLDQWRRSGRGVPWVVEGSPAVVAAMVATQLAASAVVTSLVVAYEAFLRFGVASVPADILHFGLRPLDLPRLAILTGVVILNAAVASLGVVVFRLALLPWPIRAWGGPGRLLVVLAWALPFAAAVGLGLTARLTPAVPAGLALAFIAAVAWRIGRLRARLKHASQAARLTALVLGLVVPSLVFYPSLVDAAWRARRALIEDRYAPEVLDQRRTLQSHLANALADIDRLPGLDALARTARPLPPGAPPSEAAFGVWSRTELARLRLTSSIELFDDTGALVSRFALKLPDLAGAQAAPNVDCDWDVFEEVSPFFAEERRLLHAGRAICVPDTEGRVRRAGEVVVHLMLDYANLSFVSAQSPYVAVLRSANPAELAPPAAPVDFAVFGWSGSVLFASDNRAWPLPEADFERARRGREPFWTTLARDGQSFDAYVLNDRGGIYVLGTRADTGLGHLIVMAELVSLGFVTFLAAVAGAFVFGLVAARTPASARALLREVRASFYRKLFLAFVAAAVVPVVSLAFVARTYFASLMLADIEMEATRTASVASRVVEDFGSLQVRGLSALPVVDDNVVVWLSRVIGQDVNIFDGPRLLASSERNLFASELLPTRTPAEVYRAILLEGRPSFAGRETVGPVEYLVAAAPVRIEGGNAVLVVPLTSRQQEIEAQIEELDRRVLLAALLFIMVGAGIGYWMAERIADPVSRLMRATRRIARGDLDARVVLTSRDELRRLVEAFNRMAEDLRRQRAELERTNRLAAWADMARQVAHDIKNPLTPIQLNAQHLQRVHADRGRPLGPLVDDCVANILGQVRLLRQISAEFSSFATAPQPRPVPTRVDRLVHDLIAPYRAGLDGRVTFDVETTASLPAVLVDPLLLTRALTNIVENALHAMPDGGRLRVEVAADADGGHLRVVVSDTGVGMDAEALARIFEPYFSTKTSGTGLGLTIAKRNVEACGGQIDVRSERGHGTTVTLTLPLTAATAGA